VEKRWRPGPGAKATAASESRGDVRHWWLGGSAARRLGGSAARWRRGAGAPPRRWGRRLAAISRGRCRDRPKDRHRDRHRDSPLRVSAVACVRGYAATLQNSGSAPPFSSFALFASLCTASRVIHTPSTLVALYIDYAYPEYCNFIVTNERAMRKSRKLYV
jgi:hypothetical protein